jgi:hypothetical protein
MGKYVHAMVFLANLPSVINYFAVHRCDEVCIIKKGEHYVIVSLHDKMKYIPLNIASLYSQRDRFLNLYTVKFLGSLHCCL